MILRELVQILAERNTFLPDGTDSDPDQVLRFTPACGSGQIQFRLVGERLLLTSVDIIPEDDLPFAVPFSEFLSLGYYDSVSVRADFGEALRRPGRLYTHTFLNPPLPVVFRGGERLKALFITADPTAFRAFSAAPRTASSVPGSQHGSAGSGHGSDLSPAMMPQVLHALHDRPCTAELEQALRQVCAFCDDAGPQPSDVFFTRRIDSLCRTLLPYVRSTDAFSQKPRFCADDLQAVSIVADHIDAHLQENPGLTDLSRLVFMSPSKLKTLFKEVTGYTISEYRARRRVYVSCAQLRGSDLSIQEIARRCGYRKPDNFNILFEKRMGVPPRQYRQAFRQNERCS